MTLIRTQTSLEAVRGLADLSSRGHDRGTLIISLVEFDHDGDILFELVQLPADEWQAIELAAQRLIHDVNLRMDQVNQAREITAIGQSTVI